MVTYNFGGGRGLFIATTRLIETAGRWEVSDVDVVLVVLLLSLLLVVNALFCLALSNTGERR